MPGAVWAQALEGHQGLLLQIDRALAVMVGLSLAAGGSRMWSALFSPKTLAMAIAAILGLVLPEVLQLTCWHYAAVHSMWHLCAFGVVGRMMRQYNPTLPGTTVDWIVVGLGNPGIKYIGTRHNAGVEVIHRVVRSLELELHPADHRTASICVHQQDVHKVVYAASETYMNRSGAAVQALCRDYLLTDPSKIVVVHDDLDLPPGRIRLKLGGSIAGHNGLASIARQLRTTEFARVRIGIGKPPSKFDGPNWVLSRPQGEHADSQDCAFRRAAEAIEVVTREGLQMAMCKFNGK